MIPPALFFFIEIALANLGLWELICVYMVVPDKFSDCFFYFWEECHWYFDVDLYMGSGGIDIFTIFIFLIHENRSSFHLCLDFFQPGLVVLIVDIFHFLG